MARKKNRLQKFCRLREKRVKKFSPKKKSPACEIFPFTRKNADFDDIKKSTSLNRIWP
jgi:hypothetical protein